MRFEYSVLICSQLQIHKAFDPIESCNFDFGIVARNESDYGCENSFNLHGRNIAVVACKYTFQLKTLLRIHLPSESIISFEHKKIIYICSFRKCV